MRLYEIWSSRSFVGKIGRGFALTSKIISNAHLNDFWKKYWDGGEPDGEIDGEGFEPRYLSRKLMDRFYSIYRYGIYDGLGRFVIEIGDGEINEDEFKILNRFFPNIKDMRRNY